MFSGSINWPTLIFCKLFCCLCSSSSPSSPGTPYKKGLTGVVGRLHHAQKQQLLLQLLDGLRRASNNGGKKPRPMPCNTLRAEQCLQTRSPKSSNSDDLLKSRLRSLITSLCKNHQPLKKKGCGAPPGS
jgi:hypothetical protein